MLIGHKYNAQDSARTAVDIATAVRTRLKALSLPRYARDCLTFSLCHPRCTLGYTRRLVFGVHVLLHVRLHQPFDFWRFLTPTIVTLGVSA